MNNFIFENKTKVYFGKGGVKEYLGSLLGNYGETVMLAYGGGSIKRNGVYDEIMGILNTAGKRVVEFSGIMSTPTYAKVQEGAKLAQENHVDLILAVGGGSVSDCCKVISAQANLDEDIWEMQYTKHTLPTKFIPLGTIVTVFGTGSEMNNGAVITHEEKKIKGALWGAQAEFAFLDPAYSLSVPMKQVISGAFDTLSHAMETYFGKPEENNLSDDINEAVMRSVIRNIRVLLKDTQNYDARSELAWASAMAENGVLKIGKVTDFQAHQIEHQLGAYTNCNHGAGLAVIHPVLYRHIYKSGVARFARWAQNVWGIAPKDSDEETALAGIDALAAFIREIGLPTTFTELGIPADTDFRAIGLSNFKKEQIEEILSLCEVKPTVLQTELHPYNQEPSLKVFLKENGIVPQAWYPLGHGDKALLQEPLFAQLGAKYGKSAPQIILRWHIQSGNIVIPGSKNPEHIKSNFALFDFALTDGEMAQVAALNRNVRYYTSTPEMLKKYAEMVPPVDEQK